MAMELLLFSSSRVYGGAYLDYARDAVRAFLGERRAVLFAPFALADHAEYTAWVQAGLAPFEVEVVGLHAQPDPVAAVERAAVLYVGGGNSFRLLQGLQERGLLEVVRRRVAAGDLRYMGASAGSNMACPSLRTTNDMPIVQPASFTAFGLIPFQVNPHYTDPEPGSTHMGETREQRVLQFLEENDAPVLGLREGAWLRRAGDTLRLEGLVGARLFRRGHDPQELAPGANLSWLLATAPRFDQPAPLA